MDETYWFDATPLTAKPEKAADAPDSASNEFRKAWGGGAGLKGRLEAVRSANLQGMAADLWKDFWAGGGEIKRFAEANQLEFHRQQYDRQWEEGGALPGMIFRGGERRDFLTWGEPVTVEFGNWSSVASELLQAFGYVAVRHDLGPEIDSYFQAYCDLGESAAARAFLTPERLQMLCAASMEFDIEITSDCIYLYALGITISSHDADRWAWVLSVTSRLVDHVRSWSAAAGKEPAIARPPFYTDRTVPRPADLARLPTPSPGWQAFWDLGDPHK